MASVIRIAPYQYIHVLDNNANVTRVEVGPSTFTLQQHEKLVHGPDAMVNIPPRHYCVVANPAVRKEDGSFDLDKFGQVRLRHGDQEIRTNDVFPEPFALVPGEKLVGTVSPLQVVAVNTALRLRAIRNITEGGKNVHEAGDEWLFEGPGTYTPRVEVKIVDTVVASVIKPNQALKLRARRDCLDRSGEKRKVGEEWLVREPGAYLPGVDEEVLEYVKAQVLTERRALHLCAKRTFTDHYGVERKAGEEWLVTHKMTETHIPAVNEEVVGLINVTTLNNRQYCVILNPCDSDGRPRLGQRKLVRGEVSFFLRPGEELEKGVQEVYVLSEEEALLLAANEEFEEVQPDGKKQRRMPGDRWLLRGPCEYFPQVEVEVVETRRAIPLDENEGLYVRDIKSGKVRSVHGQTYLLQPHEELWEKELPRVVEELLARDLDPLAGRSNRGGTQEKSGRRDRTRVVTFRAPHNSAVQIYDYKEKRSRVVFGPELVMLGPDEQFTVLSLSGDQPKRPNVIKSLALLLGPDFMTDIVTVETCDHARLSLTLSYNWHFSVDTADAASSSKIFQVPDFVGDTCKAIASRVRGAVASEPFDNFHRFSARIIREAVFGVDENGKIRDRVEFPSNLLCVTNVDIQAVEPVDQRTRDSLQKSVQLAIEITTKSQEAAARHDAETVEQEARGRLERQKLADEAKAENARKELIYLQGETAAIESTGQAKAEARARAEAAEIEGEAAVRQATLKAEAMSAATEAEIQQTTAKQRALLEHEKALAELEISKARELAAIESKKFDDIVKSIGPDTIRAIACSGQEMQVKMLQALGLKGFLVTDGNSPINLFNTANGLVGNATGAAAGATGAPQMQFE